MFSSVVAGSAATFAPPARARSEEGVADVGVAVVPEAPPSDVEEEEDADWTIAREAARPDPVPIVVTRELTSSVDDVAADDVDADVLVGDCGGDEESLSFASAPCFAPSLPLGEAPAFGDDGGVVLVDLEDLPPPSTAPSPLPPVPLGPPARPPDPPKWRESLELVRLVGDR